MEKSFTKNKFLHKIRYDGPIYLNFGYIVEKLSYIHYLQKI